jgi:hypothetical protein
VTGYEQTSTATLERIRDNLLAGLEEVAESLDDGTFQTCGEKGSAPPAQSGLMTLALLVGVVDVLAQRDVPGQAALRDELAEMGARR